jgi:aldehyde:ferredoxin oxidoreductase
VLAVGPAGENLSRMACLIHDASNAAGQGGFGAVWGKKKLKAISVIGTGVIGIADPKGLALARIEQKQAYAFDVDNPSEETGVSRFYYPPLPESPGDILWDFFKSAFPGIQRFTGQLGKRPQACAGCHSGCRARYENGIANEASCQMTMCYMFSLATTQVQRKVCDLLNEWGINAYELIWGLPYLMTLHRNGHLGKDKAIECDLPFHAYGQLGFVEAFIDKVVNRDDAFGDAISEGFVRAAERWGRLEQDLKSGALQYPYWGLPEHAYDPRAQLEWGYGSILGDRDINEHGFNAFYWDTLGQLMPGGQKPVGAKEAVTIYTDKMVPYHEDENRMSMLDYSVDNMYSVHIAKLVAWHRHYTRFWKQSALFCDHRWPDFINRQVEDKRGSTPDAEPLFYNAVTGKEITFADGMELGRKIWNMDNAIWTLQGRHRDMVHFADYIYNSTYQGLFGVVPYNLPVQMENGGWAYRSMLGRSLNRGKVDDFKTLFYEIEGWDVNTGHPTRKTLESLGLGYVADELENKGY